MPAATPWERFSRELQARRRLGEHVDGTLFRSRVARGYAIVLAIVGAFLTFLQL